MLLLFALIYTLISPRLKNSHNKETWRVHLFAVERSAMRSARHAMQCLRCWDGSSVYTCVCSSRKCQHGSFILTTWSAASNVVFAQVEELHSLEIQLNFSTPRREIKHTGKTQTVSANSLQLWFMKLTSAALGFTCTESANFKALWRFLRS